LVNAADPGFTGTGFNNHRGTQTVTEGTGAIVGLARSYDARDAATAGGSQRASRVPG
jgi:hypothetical protein